MHTGRTIFAQVMEFLPLPEFRTCVARYQGAYKVRSFSCLDQLLCLAFAQLTYRESLRDRQNTLPSTTSCVSLDSAMPCQSHFDAPRHPPLHDPAGPSSSGASAAAPLPALVSSR